MGRIEYEYPLFKVYYSNNSNNSNIRGNPAPAAVLGAVHQDQVRRQERETQQDVHISANQIFYLSQIFLSHGNSFENI